MRVLGVGSLYPPHHFGGYEVIWQAATQALRDRGHEVHVLTTDHHRPGVTAGLSEDTDVHRELRWYWRADAWLSTQPAHSMVGWFVGGRLGVAFDATHDRADHRWLGNAAELQGTALIGYRIAPWRGLEITPSIGLGVRRDIDLSGRLASIQSGRASCRERV